MTPRQVKAIRKRIGLSQARLGVFMGVAQNTFARWERGEIGIGGPAVKLLQLLDAHPELAAELAEPRRTARK